MRKGRASEERVCEFLGERGFDIVARNYRKLSGEIDVVAKRGDKLFFVEVKTENEDFSALERLDRGKVERMWRTAEAFVSENGLEDAEVSFLLAIVDGEDVILLNLDEAFL